MASKRTFLRIWKKMKMMMESTGTLMTLVCTSISTLVDEVRPA